MLVGNISRAGPLQETPVFSRLGRMKGFDFSDNFCLEMRESSRIKCGWEGEDELLGRLMQEVESKFASFCCALACNGQLNVRSYVCT